MQQHQLCECRVSQAKTLQSVPEDVFELEDFHQINKEKCCVALEGRRHLLLIAIHTVSMG